MPWHDLNFLFHCIVSFLWIHGMQFHRFGAICMLLIFLGFIGGNFEGLLGI